jgi:hypothetical protein
VKWMELAPLCLPIVSVVCANGAHGAHTGKIQTIRKNTSGKQQDELCRLDFRVRLPVHSTISPQAWDPLPFPDPTWKTNGNADDFDHLATKDGPVTGAAT